MARKNRVFASRRVEPEASALIISRSDTAGADKNFKRIASNGGPPSNWSTLSGLGFTNANGSQGKTKLALSRPPQRAQDKILRVLRSAALLGCGTKNTKVSTKHIWGSHITSALNAQRFPVLKNSVVRPTANGWTPGDLYVGEMIEPRGHVRAPFPKYLNQP